MAVIGELATLISARTAPFTAAMGRARKAAGSFTRSLGTLKAGAGTAIAALAGFGGAAAGLSRGLKIAADAEQAKVAFTTLLGSAEQANSLMAEIKTFAASTPFQMPALRQAATSMAAFGFSAEEIIPQLRQLGDVSAGINQPIGEIAEIYGKARVQGRLFMEDINQLTGRGIPIIGELAKQFGVAESEIRDLVSKGAVNFSHLQQAFANMTGEGGKFGGLMDAQSKTAAGAFSTLRDNIDQFLGGIGEVILTEFQIPKLLAKMTEWVQASKAIFMEWLQVAKFVFGNWQTIVSIQFNKALLGMVSWWEDMKFIFTVQIPTIVSSLAGMFKAAFVNIVTNANNFRKALMGAIRGEGWQFAFEGMGEALRKEMKAIPALSTRAKSGFEQAQEGFIQAQEQRLAQAYLQTVGVAQQVAERVAAEGGAGAPAIVDSAAKKTKSEKRKQLGAAAKGSAAAAKILQAARTKKDEIEKKQLEQLEKMGFLMEEGNVQIVGSLS